MSRIHEALKKAALERDAHQGGRTQELVEIAGEKLTREATTEGRQNIPAKAVSATQTALPADYEALLKKCQRTLGRIDPRHSVFANESAEPGGAEKFRTLRSRLYQITATRPLKRILVTSSLPAEGKTFIASNLAQSIIRQENRRVLLIDGDLRAPRLHQPFGAAAGPGLSDYLLGQCDEFQIIQTGDAPNLCLISAGQQVSNPSEILHSKTMETLLNRLSPLFDWVILDSPPAIAVHDSSLLADICDGVLFVVRAGQTDFEVAQDALEKFDEKKLIGVVLNRVSESDGYASYYHAYPRPQED